MKKFIFYLCLIFLYSITLTGCCKYTSIDVSNNKNFQEEVGETVIKHIDKTKNSLSTRQINKIKNSFNLLDSEIVENEKYKAQDITYNRDQLKTVSERLEIILNENPGIATDAEMRLISTMATSITSPCDDCLKDFERTLDLIELYTKLLVSLADVISFTDKSIVPLSELNFEQIHSESDFNNIWEKISAWVSLIDSSLATIESIISTDNNTEEKTEKAFEELLTLAKEVGLKTDHEEKIARAFSIIIAQLSVSMTDAHRERMGRFTQNPTYQILKAILAGFDSGVTKAEFKQSIRFRAYLNALKLQESSVTTQ